MNADGEKNDGYGGLYDQICYARLPRGLDPHSVPSEELAASLGLFSFCSSIPILTSILNCTSLWFGCAFLLI